MLRVIAIAILLLLTIPAHSAFWDVELVYGDGFASGDASIALDSSGNPAISYAANNTLYFAARSYLSWNSEAVGTVGYAGGYSSVLFNSSNQPCIAYIDASDFLTCSLKYAYQSSGTWHIETVDSVGWLPDYVSLAFDSQGRACIAYSKTTGTYPNLSTYLSFARRTAANTWAKQNITSINAITGPVLAAGKDNALYVGYCSAGVFRIASSTTGISWQFETVDGTSASPVPAYPSMFIKPDGTLIAAYVQKSETDAHLRYAYKSNGTWHKEDICSVGSTLNYHCTLCVTSNDVPFVCYMDPGSSNFKNMWKNSGSWFTETIDEGSQTGYRPELKTDSLGNILASYYDNRHSNVKFAWAIAPSTIDEAKSGKDGQTVQLAGFIASTAASEAGQSIYMQTSDRTKGIRVYYPGTPPAVARGDMLDIQGVLSTVDGERVLSQPFLTNLGSTSEPRPLGMTNVNLGGTGHNYAAGPPVQGQQGVVNGVGPNNIGLLVKTWGKFEYIDSRNFNISDGSGVVVHCTVPPGVALNQDWKFVYVTGASSCKVAGDRLERLLRVRSADDIVPLL